MPQTGLYVCGYCAPGGILETMMGGLAGLDDSTPRFAASGEVSADFEVGAVLPECERCGTAAGWDLVEGTIEDYRRENARTQQSVFNTLGIGEGGGARPERAGISEPGRSKVVRAGLVLAAVIALVAIVLIVL